MMDKKNTLQNILYSENVYNTQSIYCDYAGLGSPDLYTKGRFFGKNLSNFQVYLRNFENSHKMGPILGTGEFMSNFSNILPLYENSYRENLTNSIKLNKPRRIKESLQSALFYRESAREFSKRQMTIQDFSDFLYYSAGSFKKEKIHIGEQEIYKNKYTYPSGGGMYSIKLFLVVYNVAGLEPAVYIYQPNSHSILKHCSIVDLDSFIVTKRYDNKTGEYVPIENLIPSVFICCVNNFSVQQVKYGELALALAYTDCGCLLQNCGLMASTLNLNFCIWAGFKKTSAERCLNLDGLNSHIIMTSLLGTGK